MFDVLAQSTNPLMDFISAVPSVLLVLFGFSVVIFVHELGHFAVAKWAGVRVEKFAVGFGKELVGFTRGETRYAFNLLPLGGYVKMLGQEDFAVDKSGEWVVKEDPNSFTNKPVGHRMAIVSAGVIMNLIFAAFMFMIVFMIGLESLAPVIGAPLPDGPADRAGLEMGDRLVNIGGHDMEDFMDVKMAIILAEPHELLDVTFERNGESHTVQLRPEPRHAGDLLQIGITPAFDLEVGLAFPQGLENPDAELKTADVVTAVNGQPVKDFIQVYMGLGAARGAPVNMTVQRDGKTVEVTRRYPMYLLPSTRDDWTTQHLLGLVPLRRVSKVDHEGLAAEAGLERNDLILSWDGQQFPTLDEIQKSILQSPDMPINVVYQRPGVEGDQELTVTPKHRKVGVFGKGNPAIGAQFQAIDDTTPIVCGVIDQVDGKPTPAANLGIKKGDRITALDNQPVHAWYQLADLFRSKAGTTVELTYETIVGESVESVTKPFPIPPSITSILGMPSPFGQIVKIADVDKVKVPKEDGKADYYTVNSWFGAKEALAKHVGETVRITYEDRGDLTNVKRYEKDVEVTADMLDPWAMRIRYNDTGLIPMPLGKMIQHKNPVVAMWTGIRRTYFFIAQTYLTMKRMVFEQTVGVENISGPVGIVKTGAALADAGFVKLLYYLAFISANLAVINFLPLPIVDGGLMVFLLIEKIKGKPVSLKTQAVTQVIGLALIIAAFVFVTFLDFQK
jgi:regulator of sigma E protease